MLHINNLADYKNYINNELLLNDKYCSQIRNSYVKNNNIFYIIIT
jgi:hypothetical protein